MKEKLSLDKKIREKGWILAKIVTKERFPGEIVECAINVAKREYYTDFKAVPHEIALDSSTHWPEEESYLIYVKPTKKLLEQYNKSLKIISVPSVDRITGEHIFMNY